MLYICYPKCSTCRKARKWLDARDYTYRLRDIVTDNPSVEELSLWYRKSGRPLKSFFNTSGQKYRELNLKDRLTTMSEEEQLKLLASDGMLVKRPLLIRDDLVLVGFRESEWESKL
ncbi:MAG: arsenate reductase family protein [Anaerovoracaceae bacterium]|jgi:arsenate reductase